LVASAAVAEPEVSGTLGALNASSTISVGGYRSVSISVSGTLVGTVRVQSSIGGDVYTDEPGAGPLYFNATSSYMGSFPLGPGVTSVRASVSAYTSGTSALVLRGSNSTRPATAAAAGVLAASGAYLAIPVDASNVAQVLHSYTAGTVNNTWAWEYSIDGGTNWLNSAYAEAVMVSGNPLVQPTPINFAGAVSVGVYKLPLAGTATHFRFRLSTWASGSLTYTLTTGRPLVPGNPVVAVLYDVTSAVNTAHNQTFDLTGWTGVSAWWSASGGVPTFGAYQIDDAGLGWATLSVSTAASSTYAAYGAGSSLNTGGGNFNFASKAQVPRRLQFTSAAIPGFTTRIRIEARR
jgi:hypothetical protein